jgi:2,4-dienoyl-CoA reductase-like NADH-dependent reductase (Old Yellow Enzyme family)
MKRLFEQTELNGLVLKNRFLRSATWDGLADDRGACTPKMTEILAALADGGVGLIITGHAYVHPRGKHSPGQLGLDRDELIPPLTEMTETVHLKGGKIILQLGYGGFYLSKARLRKMTEPDLQEVVEAFGQASVRAQKAGFDGVQILAAHGFFLSQMLCPRYNDRTDDYGGSLENRARLLLEVLSCIRKKVGRGYPVLAKLNGRDLIEGGLILEESLQVGKWLEERSLDALEISGGLLNIANLLDHKTGENDEEAAFQNDSRAFKKTLTIPVILGGGIRSPGQAEKLLSEEYADYLSLCRPFICEPDLIHRWEKEDRRPASCISCNTCVEQIIKGEGFFCNPKKPEPAVTFFPQDQEEMPLGPPYPAGTMVQVATGLEQWESGFYPVLKIQMIRDEKIINSGLSIPLSTNDPENLLQVVKTLLEKHRQR